MMDVADMDVADMDVEVKPGFFGLPLDLFQAEAYDHLHARIKSRHRKLQSRSTTMQVAIFNLLGMLYYSARQMGNAMRAFDDALKLDKDSVNSLENLSFMYERLNRNQDAKATRQRVEDILRKSPASRARCLAEQGYALGFGVVEGKRNIQSYQRAKLYFEKAIKMGHSIVKKEELANWYMCLGISLSKICDLYYKSDTPRDLEYLRCLEVCLEAHKLTCRPTTNHGFFAILCASALRLIGAILSKHDRIDESEIKDILNKYKMEHLHGNPEQCITEALRLDPDCSQNCTRYANILLRVNDKDKRAFGTALHQLSTYISKHFEPAHAPSSFHGLPYDLWFPLVTRAKIYVKQYKHMNGSIDNLYNAHSDFTTSLDIQSSAQTLADLGEVCHLIAMQLTGQGRKGYMNEALLYFLQATLSLDGDQMPFIHYRYAQCLADYGELRPAVESYKRAIENDDYVGRNLKSFTGLVESLMKLYEQNDEPKDIIAEIAYWIDFVKSRYEGDDATFSKALRGLHWSKRRGLMQSVLSQLAQQKKTEALKVCLPPQSNADEYSHLIEISKRVSDADDCEGNVAADMSTVFTGALGDFEPAPGGTISTPCKTADSFARASTPDSDLVPALPLHTTRYEQDEQGQSSMPASVRSSLGSTLPRRQLSLESGDHGAMRAANNDPDLEASTGSHPLSPTPEHQDISAITDGVLKIDLVTSETTPKVKVAAAEQTLLETARPPASTTKTEIVAGSSLSAAKAHGKQTVGQRSGDNCGSLAHANLPEVTGSVPQRSFSELLESIPFPQPHARNQRKKQFDFFVSHSSKDADWVFHSLLPKCEKQHRFKGCVADRDWALGKLVVGNIQNSIEHSVCTILVLTQHFVESSFCKYELDQVLSEMLRNKHTFIPIKLEECEVPFQLQALTYMDATHFVNWDQLVEQLESRCGN